LLVHSRPCGRALLPSFVKTGRVEGPSVWDRQFSPDLDPQAARIRDPQRTF